MRLLLISEFFPEKELIFSGGVEARTYYLVKHLRASHRVTIISRSKTFVTASLLSLFTRIIYFFSTIIRGLNTPADLVEGSNFVTYLSAFILAKLKRVPAVAWYPDVFIGSWKNYFGLVGFLGELVERFCLRLPWDHLIALSQETKKKLVGQGIDPQKITVIYPGVNRQEFKRRVAKFSTPTIICISRLVSYKRVADLINAFRIIKTKLPQVKLIIIGSGPEKLPALTGINHYHHLTRAKLINLLSRSHVFSLPSIAEGFGLVTLEALAAGLPYVNANISINREVTHNNQGGLLFQPLNPQDLAHKILQLLQQPALYRQKVTEGKHLLKYYSWEKSSQLTLKLYQTLLTMYAASGKKVT